MGGPPHNIPQSLFLTMKCAPTSSTRYGIPRCCRCHRDVACCCFSCRLCHCGRMSIFTDLPEVSACAVACKCVDAIAASAGVAAGQREAVINVCLTGNSGEASLTYALETVHLRQDKEEKYHHSSTTSCCLVAVFRDSFSSLKHF